MATHNLKVSSGYFSSVLSGEKRTKVKFNSYNYQIGDKMILNEIGDDGYKTGRACKVEITSILCDVGLKKGYVSLGFKVLSIHVAGR